MSLQKESGTVKLHLDLSPSCQVKTIDGKPLDFIPEVKIPSPQKESEWENRLNKSRITRHISGRHLIQTEEKDNSYGENEYQFLDEWIEMAIVRNAISQREKEIAEEVEKMKDDLDYDGAVWKESVIALILKH